MSRSSNFYGILWASLLWAWADEKDASARSCTVLRSWVVYWVSYNVCPADHPVNGKQYRPALGLNSAVSGRLPSCTNSEKAGLNTENELVKTTNWLTDLCVHARFSLFVTKQRPYFTSSLAFVKSSARLTKYGLFNVLKLSWSLVDKYLSDTWSF